MKNWFEKKIEKEQLLTFFILFLLSIPAFYTLVFDITSDYPVHHEFVKNKEFMEVTYPLYHLTLNLLSLNSDNIIVINYVSILLLSALVGFKGIISFFILEKIVDNKKLVITLCISLALLASITFYNFPIMYMGEIFPNVWHNPTIIFSIPVSILLFYFSIKSLSSFDQKNFIIVSFLLVLTTVSKPNYILAFLPVYFVILSYITFKKMINNEISFSRVFNFLSLIFLPVTLLLLAQYFLEF